VLAPEVVLTGDGAGLAPAVRHPIEGAEQVARFVLGLFRQADRRLAIYGETVLVNGDLGFVVDSVLPDGTPDYLVLMTPVIEDGRIVAIYNLLNPEKLKDVPRPDPATATWPPAL
jgi:RNA polymerase sigma-70 factor (ECF subfamily)